MTVPTIYDVAANAGVSISTVSLCLNNPSRVAAATRDRVLAAADSLGYVPKADAVSRARRAVGRIGVIAPFTSYPSFGRRLNGVLSEFAAANLEVVVYDHESAVVSPLLSTLPLTGRVDGLIVMSLPVDDGIRHRLQEQSIPTVLLDTAQEGFDVVRTDDFAGGRLAGQHLLARGHTRIAFLGEGWVTPHSHQSQCEQRLAGLRSALTDAKLPLDERHVRFTTNDLDGARATARDLMASPDPPSAVFAHDDLLATAVLQAARDLGLDVPGDVAVVGFDDGEVAQALSLTTVCQPFEGSGQLAAKALLDRIGDPSLPTRTTVLDLTLIKRATT
ncbi:MAG TPA: LacI family DNA-binding transcriptional regulator [Mycobacteriales bacterium]|nr:LacI family DNA-binding transcriptional regulator [Mycobacteriales bacterium]